MPPPLACVMCVVPPESLPVVQATAIAAPFLLRSEIRRAWTRGRRAASAVRRIFRRRVAPTR